MKKRLILFILIVDIILFGISSLVFNNNKDRYISNNIIASVDNNTNNYRNAYYKLLKNNYVQNTNVKLVNNKQDLLNILYTTINSGYDYYDFNCSNNYANCTNDLVEIINDRNTLNIINSLVNVYNSINLNIKITNLNNGGIRLIVNKKYTNTEIRIINNKIDYIINMIISNDMNNEEKIRKVHDYLANSITYGNGNNAYDALINNVAKCSGYADAFSIFMDHLNINNYKVVSDTHVWNVVYINNKWKHIDVTYDDPSNNYGTNAINYDYYLINTNKIINTKEHNFDVNIYPELV